VPAVNSARSRLGISSNRMSIIIWVKQIDHISFQK